MKGIAIGLLLLGGMFLLPGGQAPTRDHDRVIRAIPFYEVELEDGFWGDRQDTLRRVTIRHMLEQCEKTGRLDNFDLAAAAMKGEKPGTYRSRYPFDDSDVYKVIEAAAYLLHQRVDPELDAAVDRVIARIAAAQEADGYLYTARTFGGKPPQDWVGPSRWSSLYLSHELYNIGHLMEAAVAHRLATGKLNLWKIAAAALDLVAREFRPGRRSDPPGHQEIELALIKWHGVSNDPRHLELARFFLDARGQHFGRQSYGEYSQDHLPVGEQEKAVGHSVRAMYMYTAMADLLARGDRPDYRRVLETVWQDVVGSKLYLTGGLGSDGSFEGFGPAYHLPNASAYAETCASVAAFFWQQRMFLSSGSSRYVDVMERMLYNGILSGISQSGDRFFYTNPLASQGREQRTAWFGCACCPPNVSRLIASLGGYLYAVGNDSLFINFFAQSRARFTFLDQTWTVRQDTRYPWEGRIRIRIDPQRPTAATLRLRIPGWARGEPVPSDLYRQKSPDEPGKIKLSVNGENQKYRIVDGYAEIRRDWQGDDRIELELPLTIHRVQAHPAVAADRGRLAVERGPLVYCLEGPDNGGQVDGLSLPVAADFRVATQDKPISATTIIQAEGRQRDPSRILSLTFIPYFSWAQRGPASMAVWIPSDNSTALIGDYPLRPVPFKRIELRDSFWLPRLETNRSVSVPLALQRNRETGRVDNFRKAAHEMKGAFQGRRFNDSDVFKAMEAAACTLMHKPDENLARNLEELITLVGRAQEADGYLFTSRSIDPAHPAPGSGTERWSNLRVSHELYNMGHMYEAAVAHYQLNGSRRFLDIAEKNASLLLKTFGPDKRRAFPGHQEIEIGLAKLYRVTGRKAYLDLARFFLDERGHYHNGETYPPDSPFSTYNSEEYLQNHKPALEQTEAIGHAVRAMYMFAAMADVAALGENPDYGAAGTRLWQDVVGRKMYLSGGVGARADAEAFGAAYELPNESAYAETCAAIGNVMWQQRLFLQHGHGDYVDVLERVLYNGLLSGVSLDGRSFFYENPLASDGGYQRSPWFEVACCPPNMTRFLPSIPGTIYATRGEDELFVNLFIANRARIELAGQETEIEMTGLYPWDGRIELTVRSGKPRPFTIRLRIPGWAREIPVPGGLYRFCDSPAPAAVLRLNGEILEAGIDQGYIAVRRVWQAGDRLTLLLPMPARLIAAHPAVAADIGRLAWQRGPLVYCLESADNPVDLSKLVVSSAAEKIGWSPKLLGGVITLQGQAELEGEKVPICAVPYYAWANRGAGAMRVWLAASAAAATIKPPGKDCTRAAP